MKKLILYITLLILVSSCKKLLVEDVRTQISNQYLNTPAGLEDGVKACYVTLRSWYGTQSGGWLTVFGTDEYTNGNADPTFNNYTANLNSSNGVFNATSGVWAQLYKGINTCNAVIAAAPNITGMESTLMNTRLAEAYFLRAHYYFLLVQTFGPLELTLTPTNSASSEATRTPIKEVYASIISDLDFSVAHLPKTPSDIGRVTLAAAQHGLAKVYLARAGSTAAESGDYAKAETLAEEVITNSDAKLLPKFEDIFAQGAGEVNPEVIFACQYSLNPLAGGGNNAHLDFDCSYDGQPAMMRDLGNGRPYAHFKPTPYMLGLFNQQFDSRFEGTFKTVWFCNKPGTYTINGKSVNMKLGDTAFIITTHEVTQQERNAVPYKIFAPSDYTSTVWPMNKKFQDSLRTAINDANGTKDLIIYRLGETYLIAAEAAFMTGHVDKALDYVNTLRRRAAIEGATPQITAANQAAMEVKPSDLSQAFFLDERARELSGEYMRWFDLVRTKTLLSRVKLYNPAAAVLIKPYHVLRPIPQVQIDATKGTSTAFPQNEGY